ncbi:UNVERIFIED_CONTAM: Aldehyde oxidase GLOX [Sesamum radiatum]|uniref:Aldehyde oxidase GLOX n=1 Tax=Sesamum radiatum TaxID=300843 RepID=A0AAW2PYQ4_SESRA
MAHTLVLSAIFRRHLLLLLLLFLTHQNILTRAADGRWDLLLSNIGISAMHMQLLHTDRVVMFDRTDFGLSNISLPDGKCRRDPNDTVLPVDCTAHSVEYDVASNSIRPLMVLTDVWCSSGAVLPDGTLVQTGGFNDGDHAVRIYEPCRNSTCDWREISRGLTQRRWYATNHILPDGRQIVIGGRRQFNYEFYPKTSSADGSYNLPFLVQTNDPRIENNLYPFVFLNGDGNLFIFANNRAILFNYLNGSVVRTYPTIAGGDPRSYPSTGSAVLLPLKNNAETEVLVCGGAPKGAYVRANNGDFVGALNTCGRIRINDLNPQWVMETMPMGRVMSDMVLLPNGEVLIINGQARVLLDGNWVGAQFWLRSSTDPTTRSDQDSSNPHIYYNFTGVLFPTDLTLEAFSPRYLDPKLAYLRPKIISPDSQSKIGLLALTRGDVTAVGRSTYQVRVGTPGSGNLAPPGYYLVWFIKKFQVRVFGSRSGE